MGSTAKELEKLKNSDKAYFTPTEVSKVLACSPVFIRLTARDHPYKLGFPVAVVGNRVKIPAKPFLMFMLGDA